MTFKIATAEQAAHILKKTNDWFIPAKTIWSAAATARSAVAEYIANTEFNVTLYASRVESNANTQTS